MVGAVDEDAKAFDLATIVMVRLGRPGSAGYTGILGLLGTLLAKDVPGAEKRRVLTDEYGVAIMGSLGECLYNEAREEGRSEGLAEGFNDGRTKAFAEVVAHIIASTGAGEDAALDIAGIPGDCRAACLERARALLAS